MIKEIFLAIVQGITEFLPISSDGHLTLFSKIIREPNLLFISFLHLASLLAVIIFTRKEIKEIIFLRKEGFRNLKLVFIGILPAVIFGFLFLNLIESSLSSFLLLGCLFIINGGILISTKFVFPHQEKNLDMKNSFIIGIFQVVALLPGISRSGITLSSGKWLNIDKEKLVKFSFLMFIPLAIGAFVLEMFKNYSLILDAFSYSWAVSFIVCFLVSLFSVNLIKKIVVKNSFWKYGIYCICLGIFVLTLSIVN